MLVVFNQLDMHHSIGNTDKTMKSPFLLLAAIIAFCGTAVAGTIFPEEAKDYIGQSVTVSGHVDEFHAARRATFLDMGGHYPHEIFTVVSFPRDGITASDLAKFEGKTISVSGTVTLYRGKPEIIVTSLKQISTQ